MSCGYAFMHSLFPLLPSGDLAQFEEHKNHGCTHRFHAIFHMPRRLTKFDVIYICFLLFYHIELYMNKMMYFHNIQHLGIS